MRIRHATAAAVIAALAGTAHGRPPSTVPFPAQFNLAGLLPQFGGNGANGFVISGIEAYDYSGVSVSSAGDVNGDGIDDLIIGANGAGPNGQFFAGESYVVFGSAGIGAGGSINLSALNGTSGFVLNGIDAYDFSGVSVSSAGDVNGDGIDDLIIGAHNADPNGEYAAGESYVVFGGVGVGAGGSINLSSLNGANGFVLNGIDSDDLSGLSVSSAGDVNGDGVDDLIIGAHRADPNGSSSGESYVVFGGAGVGAGGSINLSSLNGANGFVLNGIDASDFSGRSVSTAGDVNGDGVHDLIIGAYLADPNGQSDAGESYVVFGAPGVGSVGVLNLSSLNGANGFVLNGIDPGDRSGRSVSSAGDVNGDGVDDLIIGAHAADPNGQSVAGESYAVFGAAGVGAGGSINLSSLNGANGFVLNGIDIGDGSGFSVSSAGDVNGDGIDDLIIGAPYSDPSQSNAGESYIVFGAVGVGAGGSINLSSLNGANGFVLYGIDTTDLSGRSVSCAGDVNGDGIDDLIIGAHYSDPNGQSVAGESYVVFGRASANVWKSPAGGNWDFGPNWQGLRAPAGGFVRIVTPVGVTVTGPAGAVFLDTLTLAATAGRTTLNLQPFSLVSLASDFTVPASGAVGGSGTLATHAGFTNNGLIQSEDLTLIASSGLTSTGRIDLTGLGQSISLRRLGLFGALTNSASGEVLLRHGTVELEATGDIDNAGKVDITFATADILASLDNSAASSRLSVSGGSSALITGDFSNVGSAQLSNDSEIVILGTLFGNGVTGQGGGATSGSVFIAGGIQPGMGRGIASFGGDVGVGPGAITIIEIGGTTPGVNLDQIKTLANFGAGGTLRVELVSGFVPSPGDEYQVLSFATSSGAFSNIILDPALITAGAETDQLLTLGVIVVPPPCPGNANGDGIVDFNDINAVIANWLSNYAPGTGPGDANNDGIVDFNDINAVIANWLSTCP